MTIAYLGTVSNLISIKAPELDDYIANTNNYTGVTVSVVINCNTVITAESTYTNQEIIVNTNPCYIANGLLYIQPVFLGLDNFSDSIIKITIKFNTTNGYTQISNCIFVDVTYKCKVATFLQNVLDESSSNLVEKPYTVAHVLHYALTNGGNCGCNCDDMCSVFNNLTDLIVTANPETTNDCGC